MEATGLKYSRRENFHDQLQDGREVSDAVIGRLIDRLRATIEDHQQDASKANISLVVLECTMLFMHHVRITEAFAESHPGLQVVTVLSLTLNTIANTYKGIQHKQEIARRVSQFAPAEMNTLVPNADVPSGSLALSEERSDADVSKLVRGMKLQWKYKDTTLHPMRWSSYLSLERLRGDLEALSEQNKLRPLRFRAESGDKWTFPTAEEALAILPTM